MRSDYYSPSWCKVGSTRLVSNESANLANHPNQVIGKPGTISDWIWDTNNGTDQLAHTELDPMDLPKLSNLPDACNGIIEAVLQQNIDHVVD